MNVSQTIRERRTIRKFKSTPIAQEQIVSLLKEAAGFYEADGTPHWRCLYIGTPEAREKLAEHMLAKVKESGLGKLLPAPMTNFMKKMTVDIPAHVIFIAEAADTQRQRDINYAAVCSIIQNVQLLGWEQGLGMLWYTDPMICGESFYKKIGLREGERCAGILEIGYFEKTPKARSRTPAEKNWTIIGEGSKPPSSLKSPSPQNILELLNEAVWAPNDGMREPWRFIYVPGFPGGETALPFLLVVAKEEADLHKQDEDYAAVCCLVQNFQLLAQSKPWHVRRLMPEWIYDGERSKRFGLRPLERIVAVLELRGEKKPSKLQDPPPSFKITLNFENTIRP